jgi:hypothetical protein
LFAVKCLRLAVDDHATLLDNYLGAEGLGAVLASASYYRTHSRTDLVLVVLVVLSYRVRRVGYSGTTENRTQSVLSPIFGTTWNRKSTPPSYHGREDGSKRAENGTK